LNDEVVLLELGYSSVVARSKLVTAEDIVIGTPSTVAEKYVSSREAAVKVCCVVELTDCPS
jgi:hypothetical protein